jgi:NAD(P)-dependent dehydrogenase (short-subunit alcohol dehydrogenase family)
MNDVLAGRCAVVTGAARGLGAATARTLVDNECRVAVLDLNASRLNAVAADLGPAALPIVADIAGEDAVEAAIGQILGELGRIDYLVNCAGIDHTLSLTDLSVDQWDRIMAVNLRGPFLLTRAIFPLMCRQNDGHIVNVASTAAVRAWPNASAYCASKWGLVGFTRAIGTEGRAHNVRATAIIPGGMQTEFFDRPDLPIKPDPTNLNDPANVARVIAFTLAQPAASVVQEIIVTPLTETSWP